MAQRVVVVGGGYGGVAVAQELDSVADVVLVEPRDTFVHVAATLRAAVDPAWEERTFYPYDSVLRRGRVVHDWARSVSPGLVRLSATEAIEADHVVLATGTAYPFPARYLEDTAELVQARLRRLRADLARCDRVLVVGAGPVGLELAGELTAAFPDLGVTVVEREDEILPGGYLPEMRAAVRDQLGARGVEILTGAPLGSLPDADVGTYRRFTVATTVGAEVTAQMWFRCYGSRPVTDYLDAELRRGMHHDGTLPVTPHLTLVGQDRVWAVGDVTDLPESKRATAARAHAAVVARNIRDVIEGREPSATYAPAPELIVLPLGPDGGVSQVAGPDGAPQVEGAEWTSQVKGADLFTGAMAGVFSPRG